MNSIKDKVKLPSEALQHMVDGLRKKWVYVHMETYGRSKDVFCFGCAATNAVCNIFEKSYNLESIDKREFRAKFFDLRRNELLSFEWSIDKARQGNLSGLMFFFDRWNYDEEYDNRFDLTTANYEKELPKVEALISELKADGL